MQQNSEFLGFLEIIGLAFHVYQCTKISQLVQASSTSEFHCQPDQIASCTEHKQFRLRFRVDPCEFTGA